MLALTSADYAARKTTFPESVLLASPSKLFQLPHLLAMSASAVVHACVLAGEDDLSGAALHAKAQPNSGSALQAVKASEFYRFLSGAPVPEFTSGQKGRAQSTTLAAYAAIQALSAKRHKAINQAICGLTRNYIEGFDCDPATGFEIPQGSDLFTDGGLGSHSGWPAPLNRLQGCGIIRSESNGQGGQCGWLGQANELERV